MQAWRWCEGWHPARIAAAAAYYDIEDVDQLTELLLAIRDRIEAWKAAQRKAEEGARGA